MADENHGRPRSTSTETVPSATAEAAAEPWMRNTHTGLDTLRRGVIHALEMAEQDALRWTACLSDAELFAVPAGLPSVAFHLRHIVRSLDRLLTYAEGNALTPAQLAALSTEHDPSSAAAVRAEFTTGIQTAKDRVLLFDPHQYERPRGIGRAQLPSTVGGLLLHGAEHTQRHAGQMVTTAKATIFFRAERSVPG